MNKFIVATLSIGALTIGAAHAADMRAPAYKAPAPAPVVYNWTGCYVGAGGGYGMFNQDTRGLNNGIAVGPSTDGGGRGWFGTVQVGCDYQAGSNWVIGAFADFDWSGLQGDVFLPFINHVADKEKLKHSWAAGGRVGWLPFQQLLVFVSGGYTQARFGETALITVAGTPTSLTLEKHSYSGWFLGSGYEYGIGWLPGLFWKTEYRFADYGKETVNILSVGAPTGLSQESHKYVQTVRSELVWRFNFGGQRY